MTSAPNSLPPTAPGSTTTSQRLRAKFFARSRFIAILFLLMMPTLVSMVVISYYPKIDVIIKAFYEWIPNQQYDYIGTKNFEDAFADPLFWQSFTVVAIMLVANLFKMIPSVIVAVALHRLTSDKARYIYQVLFVLPMVIPAMVWLLVWKSFFDPDFGILNKFLQATGLMHVLAFLDGHRETRVLDVVTTVTPAGERVVEEVQATEISGGMPAIAEWLNPIMYGQYELNEAGQRILYEATGEPLLVTPGLEQLIGGVWLIFFFGAVMMGLAGMLNLTGSEDPDKAGTPWKKYGMVLVASALPALLSLLPVPGLGGIGLMALLAIIVMWVMSRVLGDSWVIWAFIVLYGIWAGLGELWRLPIYVGVAIVLAAVIVQSRRRATAQDITNYIGYAAMAIGALFVAFGMIWVTPTEQFAGGTPAWLGNQHLVLPAIIIWGFPWVATIGVLIYLAGLQQISQDVYEAAELDGVGPLGKFFRIELPLIMTQVRINLIFMTIGTLTGYEMYLILLGAEGGPGNVGIVPGLYMYNESFNENRYGYACALGMVLFVMILLLTIIYQRYVKVEK